MDQHSKFLFLQVVTLKPTEYTQSFTAVGPAVSEPQGFENVDTTPTDGDLIGFISYLCRDN